MRRYLVNAVAALSLLLGVAAGVFWVRSHRRWGRRGRGERDMVSFTHRDPVWWVISYPGRAVVCRQTGRYWEGHDLPHDLPRFRAVGFAFGGTRGTGGGLLWNLEVPYWFLCGGSLVVPGVVGVRRWREGRRRRRERDGLCRACGYDLRGSAGRCPECGAGREEPGA